MTYFILFSPTYQTSLTPFCVAYANKTSWSYKWIIIFIGWSRETYKYFSMSTPNPPFNVCTASTANLTFCDVLFFFLYWTNNKWPIDWGMNWHYLECYYSKETKDKRMLCCPTFWFPGCIQNTNLPKGMLFVLEDPNGRKILYHTYIIFVVLDGSDSVTRLKNIQ